MIIRAGESPSGVFYLKKGFTRLFSVSKSGEEFSLIIFKKGDLFPLIWAINNPPNSYFLEAMTPCELLRAPRNSFMDFVKGDPELYFEVTSRVLVRFGALLRRMEYMAFGDAYSKISAILLICAERFGKKKGKKVIIEVPLTHHDVASLVGVTRETASIELKKMETKGLISHKGHLIAIKNIENLKKESLGEVWG